MFRLLTHLLGKPFEECKSCETLKEQLEYERANNKDLTKTLLDILHPTIQQAVPVEVQPVTQAAGLWARRRSVLEEKSRQAAAVLKQSKNVGMPDDKSDNSIEKLEAQLGITEISDEAEKVG